MKTSMSANFLTMQEVKSKDKISSPTSGGSPPQLKKHKDKKI